MTQQLDWKAEREAIRARLAANYPSSYSREHRDYHEAHMQWTEELNDCSACQYEFDEAESEHERLMIADLRTFLAHAEEDEREIDVLRTLNHSLGHPVDSPCGHSSIYAVSNDGGAHIRCLMCRESKLESELALRDQRISEGNAERERLTAWNVQLESELARTKEAISRSELGEVWIWSSGDPEDGDNADTITCPILIESEAFRLILAELAAARKANEEVVGFLKHVLVCSGTPSDCDDCKEASDVCGNN